MLARRPTARAAKLRAVMRGDVPVRSAARAQRPVTAGGRPPATRDQPPRRRSASTALARAAPHRRARQLPLPPSRYAWEQDRRREREARARGDDSAATRRATFRGSRRDAFGVAGPAQPATEKRIRARSNRSTTPCRAPSPASGSPRDPASIPAPPASAPPRPASARSRDIRVSVGVDIDAHRRARRWCEPRPSSSSSTAPAARRRGRSPIGQDLAERAADALAAPTAAPRGGRAPRPACRTTSPRP